MMVLHPLAAAKGTRVGQCEQTRKPAVSLADIDFLQIRAAHERVRGARRAHAPAATALSRRIPMQVLTSAT
jgi:hypothetical protein